MSGVEDIEVSVFDPTATEVGGWVCPSVEWSGVLSLTLTPSADQVSIFFNGPETDVFCYFRLAPLVDEDDGVVTRIASIEESPSESWMGGVI